MINNRFNVVYHLLCVSFKNFIQYKNMKEYEMYAKEIVDRFSDMCAVKRDYIDYCNCIQGKNLDTYYNFRQANDRTLIDMLISGEFEREDVQKSITERQEVAKKWLSENLLTYDEWIAKHKTNS